MITFKIIAVICLLINMLYFITEFIFGFKSETFKHIFGAVSFASVILLAACIGELT